eukprot:TRINITY_DN8136_c0_g1_i2.p1 TRINITY_DN8136_c0_g1~~TRINITY_DN8136_c0_g1_i2.p1  ORF type:complete len:359 (+),score=34.69 TRINITY_DN8136_c0_g1_i2:99-1175(+)
MSCVICLAPSNDYVCCHDHHACANCLYKTLVFRLKTNDSSKNPWQCPGLCSDTFTWQDAARAVPQAEQAALELAVDKLHHQHSCPNTTSCPTCGNELRLDVSNFPLLSCNRCQQECCYYHGLSHVGQPCHVHHREPIWQRFKTWLWMQMHTRKCPSCHKRIVRNGGCNHMTCTCGWHFCWMCGQRYGHGYRHGRKLLCWPAELREQCHDWRLWAQRIPILLLLLAASPLFALALLAKYGIWAPLRYIITAPYNFVRNRYEAYVMAEKAAKRKRELQRGQVECSDYMNHLRAQGHTYTFCLTCQDRTTCMHVNLDANQVCRDCGHFDRNKAQTCLAHYGNPCLFCGHIDAQCEVVPMLV